jgi:phytoene dehydrogenase-like protein
VEIDWLQPDVPLAHVLDGGRAAILDRDLDATVAGLGTDGPAYRKLMTRIVAGAPSIVDAVLGPHDIPKPTVALVDYAHVGLRSVESLTRARFDGELGRAVFSGIAAHSVLPLDAPLTAGVAVLFAALAHSVGWPIARGGSQAIADALVREILAAGGEVHTGVHVDSLDALGSADAVLLDLTPVQVLKVASGKLPDRYRRTLEKYRYGPGVCKVDWALDGPVPWTNPDVARAGTVHLGGTLEEVAAAELAPHRGEHAERPFVLFSQPTVLDPSRAPSGGHVGWAYCHVPAGSTLDRSPQIEAQVERFAPGFRDRILARNVLTAADIATRDPNRVGGDIAGGVSDWRQLLARPSLERRPWVTSVPGLYLCSSATPPGGGVHGMCGWHAAHQVLRRQG